MLKKNLFYNGLLSISQFLFPLITFPYSSRILGPHGIGTVNFIDSFTQYFILFAALGIPLYGVREISKQIDNKQNLETTFNQIFSIHLISACIFSLIYLSLSLLLPNLRVHIDLVLIGILIIMSNVLSVEWLFQGLEQFSYIVIRSLIVRCLSVVMLFVFLKQNSPPIIYYAIFAGGVVLNGVINMFHLKKLVKIKLTKLDLKKHVKPLFVILASTLAVSVYLLMDTIILGFIKGEKAVGIYATALRIVRLPLALFAAVNAVIIPRISRAFAKHALNDIATLANKSFSLICIIGFPIVTGIFIASDFLIKAFAGEKFGESVLPLKLLAPMVVVNGIGNIVCSQLLMPLGKEKYLLKSYLISMIFSLVVNIILINYYSYIGAAVGLILTEIVATGLCFYFLKMAINITFHKKILLQSLMGSLFFFPIAYVIRGVAPNYILQEVSVIIACMVFYCCYVLFFIKNGHIQSIKKAFIHKYFSVIN